MVPEAFHNIIDYVWAQPERFSERPLCRVDSLVFSQLCYFQLPSEAIPAWGWAGLPIHELYRVKHEALEVIEKVPDDKLRELLLLRYISVMTWEEIAVSMGLSYRHVCRLHGDALSQAKKYLPMA